uniref:MFS transporter n=1 Tax=Roseomonas rosulenta TaxID=2748667 RepID=UPI001E321C83
MTASRPLTVAVLGTTQTLSWASSYYLPAILAAPIATEFGVFRATIFGVFSAALLLTAFLGPAAGRAIDRRGGRDVLALSNIVFAVGLLLMGLSPGPVVFGLAWAVMGVGMAMGLYDAAFATLAGLYGKEARNSITGITLIAGFASTVGWPTTALMEAEWGWRGACLGWAALHVVLGLPLNRLLVPRAPPPAKAAAATAGETGPPPGGRDMALLAFVLATAGFSAAA